MASGRMTIHGGTHLRGLKGIYGESRLRPLLVPEDTTTRFYQKLKGSDSNFVAEVVVINPVGPWKVFHGSVPYLKDGVLSQDIHHWGCRETAPGEITFFAHPAYTGGPINVWYDQRICKPFRMYHQPNTLFSFPGGNNDHSPRGNA